MADIDLFGNTEPARPLKNKSGSYNYNPMIPAHGPGPDNTRCKTCKHLEAHHQCKVWYKCKLRGHNKGPATDHRVNWPACGKYEVENEA